MYILLKVSFWYHLQMFLGRDICVVPRNRGKTPSCTCYHNLTLCMERRTDSTVQKVLCKRSDSCPLQNIPINKSK